ncbi:MAG: TPM domain-containing protein [Burkholderiales bacterium]|nr:TPM domain-containing protein [Burkholderiales bacterium]
MARLLRWLALLTVLLAGPSWAQALQQVPTLTARVIDQTATLSDAQRQALEAKLAAFEAQSGPQIVILLVRSTAPEDIAAYAFRVADQWKIGRRSVGDGLLVLVAKDDRVARIEVARALEGSTPTPACRFAQVSSLAHVTTRLLTRLTTRSGTSCGAAWSKPCRSWLRATT